MNNVQAQFQMLDSYVKEYNLTTNSKVLEKTKLSINGKIGFGIIKITEKDNILIGEIELSNSLDVVNNEEIKAKINIIMRGLFSCNKDIGKEEFEKMLKLNGATTLSHLIRTYIHTNTAISGMPNVITPMINFVEFFKKNKMDI